MMGMAKNNPGKAALALLVLAFGWPLLASGDFAMPQEVPGRVRRDALTVEEGKMQDMAKALRVIARVRETNGAAERRLAAQCLALAEVLHPEDDGAANDMKTLAKGEKLPRPNGADAEAARELLRREQEWLSSPGAGEMGHVVGDCIGDILAGVFPSDEWSKSWLAEGEKGNWADWVPGVEAFREKQAPPAEAAAAPTEAAPKELPKLALDHAQMKMLLWKPDPQSGENMVTRTLVEMKMHAHYLPDGKDAEPLVVLTDETGTGLPAKGSFGKGIGALVLKNHPELKPGLRVELRWAMWERQLGWTVKIELEPAMYLLASAAATGNSPTGLALVGLNADTGALSLPDWYWAQFEFIAEHPVDRLIVSPDAQKILEAFLVYDQPEFFMKNETLIAKDAQELEALSKAKPDGPLADALADFAKMQDESKAATSVRTYLSRRAVQQRLYGILRAAPNHLSARMLITLAENRRPAVLARPVLAAELLQALDPMQKLMGKAQANSASYVDATEAAYDEVKPKVDALRKYAASADEDLFTEAKGVLDDCRDVKRRGVTRDVGIRYAALRAAGMKFQKSFKDAVELLENECNSAISK